MQEILIGKLYQYILQNNLDLLIALQEKGNVDSFLKEKMSSIKTLLNQLINENSPAYLIEERCMDVLTQDLRPSKYTFLTSVLEEEFESEYSQLKENGILPYEVFNLIKICNPVFEGIGFSRANENDRNLRYAIIGAIQEYFSEQSVKM